MDDFQPIKRVKVSEQVFEQLKERLLSGGWKPGEKLPSENELADRFQVSRITIRYALQKLTALGLIETKLGEGSFVRRAELGSMMNSLLPVAYLGRQSTLEVLEFRLVVETETAGLAALRATDADVRDLREILDRMTQLRNDFPLYAREDLAFHVRLAQCTRNSLIISTHAIMNDILGSTMRDIVDHMGSEYGIYCHSRLLEAVAAHDRALAVEVMREHIGTTVTLYEEAEESRAAGVSPQNQP